MMPKPNNIRRPSLWAVVPVVMLVTAVWTYSDYPLDYWLHVTNGRWMVEHNQLITVDTFSHTIEGQAVENQPWLGQIVMYAIHQWGGYAAGQFAAGLGYGLALAGVIYLTARRCGNWLLASLGGGLAFALMATNLGIRPQVFSALLFVLQLMLLLQIRSGRRRGVSLVGCFLVMCLWTNMHGAYPVGVVLAGIMAMSVLFDRSHEGKLGTVASLWMATAVSAAACFVRPFPGDTIDYVTNCSARSLERGIQEWMPTSLDTACGPAFLASVLIVLGILSWSRRRMCPWEQMMLAAFFVLAASSQRMVIWWGLILPVVMARPADHLWRRATRWVLRQQDSRFARWLDRRAARPTAMDRWVGAGIAVLAVLYIACSTPWMRTANPLLPVTKRVATPNGEPRGLVDSVRCDGRRIRTYAPLSWGSYLSWASHGQMRTFLDTRIDFFPDAIWDAFTQIGQGRETALDLLDAFQVELVFCSPQHSQLTKRLKNSAQWRLIASDADGCVFAPREQPLLPAGHPQQDQAQHPADL